MKVSEAISILTRHYKPEDDIIISWWDKEWVDSLVKPLTDEEWTELAEYLDNNGDNLGDQMTYDITSAIDHLATDWGNNA